MSKRLLVVGGGIAGMALALAASRQGVAVELWEQAQAFSEVGAGIQLGPNAVRVLTDWGLAEGLQAVAAFPRALLARDACSGRVLARRELGEAVRARYGQPYATIHRADALGLLLQAARRQPGVTLKTGQRLARLWQTPAGGVTAVAEAGQTAQADALVGCDGLWSVVRRHVMAGPQGLVAGQELPPEAPPRLTGHVAYRGMVAQAELPPGLRTHEVTAWLGPRLHVVAYPVRRGDWVNVVAVVHGQHAGAAQGWSHEAPREALFAALGMVTAPLMGLLEAVPGWKLWPLADRPPMTGAYGHAQGPVALAGDAAHPMRPYLAQGAAMALEDAWTLGRLLQQAQAIRPETVLDWPALLARYAHTRWRRNARVQAESARHGGLYHAQGVLRAARDAALALLGARLLDKPWLYAGPPEPV